MISLNGGYAMIKYNSTQEELQFAYRSKKPVLCYDENQRAHWAVIEETATESVDEETQEPITIYEYSYRLIDEASDGGKLYQHNIYLKSTFTDNRKFACSVISKSNAPFTVTNFMDFLSSNGFNNNTNIYPVCATNILGIFYANGIITGVGSTDQPSFGPANDYILIDVVINIL